MLEFNPFGAFPLQPCIVHKSLFHFLSIFAVGGWNLLNTFLVHLFRFATLANVLSACTNREKLCEWILATVQNLNSKARSVCMMWIFINYLYVPTNYIVWVLPLLQCDAQRINEQNAHVCSHNQLHFISNEKLETDKPDEGREKFLHHNWKFNKI